MTLSGRRRNNEDSVVDLRFPDGRHLVAVADGMGGHQSGEVASSMAVDVLSREVAGGRDLREAVRAANLAIYNAARRDPRRSGMGTTLVALLRQGSTYEIANVGDSRAYRIARTGIFPITRDHSFAAEARQSRLMSPEEIARSPWRNALTRSLGAEESVEVDLFGPFGWTESPHIALLCSDGVYRSVSDEAIQKLVLSCGDLASAAEVVATRAFQGGSDDNMSVAGVEFGRVVKMPNGPQANSLPPQAARPVAFEQLSAPPPTVRRTALAAADAGGHSETQTAISPALWGSVTEPGVFRWIRRFFGVIAGDNTLFGVSVAIPVLWLLAHPSTLG